MTEYMTEGSDDDLGMLSGDDGENFKKNYCVCIIINTKLLIDVDLEEAGLKDLQEADSRVGKC